MPKVSALMPVYNTERFIGEAIESVLAQDYDDIEIIVVDDGSTDRTAEIAKSYPKVRYILKEHSGIMTTRNRTLREATGEFITFIDADDLWCPGKLKMELEFLEQHPEFDVVRSKMKNFTAIPENELTVDEKEIFENENVQLLGMHCFRKYVVDKVGFFDESLKYDEDTEWLVRMKVAGFKVGDIDKVHLLRRVHDKNISVKRGEDNKNITLAELKRLMMKSIRSGIKLQNKNK